MRCFWLYFCGTKCGAERCGRFLEKVGEVDVLEGTGDWLIGRAQVDDDKGGGGRYKGNPDFRSPDIKISHLRLHENSVISVWSVNNLLL